MNILIPMCGKGLRLKNAGISIPKPLIEVDGLPMFHKVTNSINIDGNFHYVVRQEHVTNYSIDSMIKRLNNGTVHVATEDNEGQVQTCLLAKESIDNSEPLLIVNCDNYFVWNHEDFESLLDNPNIDGAAFTFKDPQKRSHWCFAKVHDNNLIKSLVEKNPVSDIALAGGFYWRRGSDFVRCAEQVVADDIRTGNGEFYLGSVFNLAIAHGKRILNYPIEDMKSFGTPEELQHFLNWVKDKNEQVSVEAMLSKGKIMRNRNIQDAIDELREGQPVIVVDEHDRENEGDIVIAGEAASADNLIFSINYVKGLMCIACAGEILDRLDVPLMVEYNTDKNETPFTVSVDAANGTTTGMSVNDRLTTIDVLVDDNSKPQDLNRPGHLFPLRAKDGLLKERRGHTEGSVALMKLAGLKPVAIISEIMTDEGTMAKGGQINKFATEHGLTLISIEEIYEEVYGESL